MNGSPAATPKAAAEPGEAIALATRISSPARSAAAHDPTRTTRSTPSSARSPSTSAALGPPIPVDWIVSSEPPVVRPL
jgi:hypothetical protein